MAQNAINIKNKRASFDYYLIEHFTAGIVLVGTEIKSIRLGKANLSDAYCYIKDDELWIKNMHIAEYTYGTYNNHEPKRERKLLLQKKEIKKIINKMKDKGLTIVPKLLFLNEKGLAKIEVSIAKGKKLYDKRETLKEKDAKREMEKL